MDHSVRGMTLIEIMVAVAVLTIALVALLTATPVATKTTSDAEEHEIARRAIEVKIAEIREKGLGDLGTTIENPFDVEGLTRVQDDTMCGIVTLGDFADGLSGAREITVGVSWRGIDKADRQIEVATYVAP